MSLFGISKGQILNIATIAIKNKLLRKQSVSNELHLYIPLLDSYWTKMTIN